MIPDEAILDAIRWHIGENGYSPSVRELCAALGITSPSAMKYRLDRLREKGLVTFDRYKQRTLRLTEKGEKSCN